MKNFSSHVVVFYYAACLRKKVVSCPDDLLVTDTDTDTEYLFNVVNVKHDTAYVGRAFTKTNKGRSTNLYMKI